MSFGLSRNKYYDPKFDSMSVTVLPGDFYISKDSSEMLVTVLGSCVSACIRDKKLGIGGMNHFLLARPGSDLLSSNNRYGSFAMEELINELLKQGARRENLEAKVFGGASVIKTSIAIGDNNNSFVLKYLKNESIPIISEDLGGVRPRRIHYWPSSGRVSRHLLQTAETRLIINQEDNYKKNIEQKPNGNSVELF